MKKIIVSILFTMVLSSCSILSPPELERQENISIQSFFNSEGIGEQTIADIDINLEDLSSDETDDEIEINELLDILFESSDDSSFITY